MHQAPELKGNSFQVNESSRPVSLTTAPAVLLFVAALCSVQADTVTRRGRSGGVPSRMPACCGSSLSVAGSGASPTLRASTMYMCCHAASGHSSCKSMLVVNTLRQISLLAHLHARVGCPVPIQRISFRNHHRFKCDR